MKKFKGLSDVVRAGVWRNTAGWFSRSAAQNRNTADYSPELATQLAPVASVVTYIARQAAASDLVCEKQVDGQWEMVDNGLTTWLDPQKRPNQVQSRYDFVYNLATNLLVGGEVGVKILDRARGMPDTVISIPANLFSVEYRGTRMGRTDYIPGLAAAAVDLRYWIDGRDDEPLAPYTALTPDGDFLHIRYITLNNIVRGVSPLFIAVPPLRMALAADAYAEYGLTSPWPLGVWSSKGKITDEAAKSLVRQFQQVQRDPDKTTIPSVVSGDLSFVSTYIRPEDLQLLETRKFAFSEACSLYGVQEGLLSSANSRSSGTSIKAMLKGHAVGTQIPFNNLVAKSLSELVPDGFRVRLVPNHLTEMDPAEQSRVMDRLIKAGVLKPSEARAELGLPVIEGLDEEVCPLVVGRSADGGGESDSGRDDGDENERPTGEDEG